MSNKLSHYTVTLSGYCNETLGDLREEIRRVNKEHFGGKPVLKLTNKCKFEVSYDGCYYEGDMPSISVIIPYKNPVATKKASK